MKLRFYLNEKGEKIYTLKKKIREKETKPAHYKFIRIKSAPEIGDSLPKKNNKK